MTVSRYIHNALNSLPTVDDEEYARSLSCCGTSSKQTDQQVMIDTLLLQIEAARKWLKTAEAYSAKGDE